MQIQVVRRGGFAGIALHAAIDTAELSPEAAGKAESALRGLPFGRPPSPPRHPDSFQYEITVVDGGAPRSAVLDEADLSDGLRPLIEAALTRGNLD